MITVPAFRPTGTPLPSSPAATANPYLAQATRKWQRDRTNRRPDDQWPRFSPDGGWVLFIRNHAAYRVPRWARASTSARQCRRCGMSPDGRELAFVRFSTVVPNVGTEVGIASVQDGTSRIVHRFSNQMLRSPTWRPTAALLLWSRSEPEMWGTPLVKSHCCLLMAKMFAKFAVR